MPDIAENQSDSGTGFDPRIQTEDIAFKPGEMLPCSGCKRMNPPNRLKCLYCANELEIKPGNAGLIKPNLRKLEGWERGFNVILREPILAIQFPVANAASFLSIDPDDLTVMIGAAVPLPLIRVESQVEADILVAGLDRLGLKCSTLTDADLADDKLPVRLGNIELRENGIAVTDFNTRTVTEIDDLALVIPGILTTNKVDSLEKKGRGGKTKVLDESATSSDESILDLYSRSDQMGFRVHLTGFDYSCLGDDKSLIAVENMRRLVTVLKEHAPSSRLITVLQESSTCPGTGLGNRIPKRSAGFEAIGIWKTRIWHRGLDQQFTAVYKIFAAAVASVMKKKFPIRSPRSNDRRDERGFKNRAPRDSNSPAPVPANSSLIYGVLPVLEALRADNRRVDKVLIADGAKEHRLSEIIDLCRSHSIAWNRVPRETFAKHLDPQVNHQGVVAFSASADYVTTDDIFEQAGDVPLIVLLDGVEDPRNLGAILRAAECAGVDGVIIPERRAVGLNDTVAKSSAGAIEYVKVAKTTNLNRLIEGLKERDIWVVGTTADAETSYTDWDWTRPSALVLGGEGGGLHRLVAENCDVLVKIPMYGKIDSLNVSVAAGVILFEARRQRSSGSEL